MATTPTIERGLSFEPLIFVELFDQFTGAIVEIVSTTSIKLEGDASSFFSDGNTVIVPNYDFTAEIVISGAPSYSAGNDETTINFVSGSFDSNYLGLTLALKIDVTERLTKRGVKSIDQKVEGRQLNDFDNGVAAIEFKNDDFYFWDKDGDGILQTDVLWGKIFYKNRGGSKTLMFGGNIDLNDAEIDFTNRLCKIKMQGHSRELERYPAFLVNNPSALRLVMLVGFDINSFVAIGDGTTKEGIKVIEYEPFSDSNINVSVESVSNDTTPGIKVLEFRLPFFYRWDNGIWYEVNSISDYTNADGLIKMYGKDGSVDSNYAMVKFGDEDTLNTRPDFDTEMWVYVEPDGRQAGRRGGNKKIRRRGDGLTGRRFIRPGQGRRPELPVKNQGTPTVRFDNGTDSLIRLHPQRTVKYVDIGTTFTEISDEVHSTNANDNAAVLEATDDYLLIISPDRFFGLKIILQGGSGFSASDLDFYYSTGGEGFSSAMGVSESLTDGTNEFQQDGIITWGDLEGWRVNTLKFGTGSDESFIGYAIKIVRNSATGSCTLQEIQQQVRVTAENGDELRLFAYQDLVPTDNREEEIIIERSYDGTYSAKQPYRNVSVNTLLTRALDRANFITSKKNVTELKFSAVSNSFNVWGRTPLHGHSKFTTALLVDDSNEILYAAVENEIWKCSFDGTWELLVTVDAIQYGEKIIKLDFGSTTDEILMFGMLGFDFHFNKSTQHFFSYYKYVISTDTLTDVSNDKTVEIINGFYTWRQGLSKFDGGSGNYYREYGDVNIVSGVPDGENLTVPYTQVLISELLDNNNALLSSATLFDVGSDEWPYWYFDSTPSGYADNSGPHIDTPMGHYGVRDDSLVDASPVGPIGIPVRYGFQGIMIKFSADDNVYTFIRDTDANANEYFRLQGAGTDNPDKYKKHSRHYHYAPRTCVAVDDDNDLLYFGFTEWNEDDGQTISFSYVTKSHRTKVDDWDIVEKFNGIGFTPITSNVNAGTTELNAIAGSGDIIYFGHDQRFRDFQFQQDHHNNSYAIEYWDGSTWSTLDYTPDADLPDDFVCFRIPEDWATTAVNGTTKYWARIRCTSFSANADLEDGRLLEQVIVHWLDTADENHYVPTSLLLNPNEGVAGTIHCCIFNKENNTSTYPFQWFYAVIDLNDNSIAYNHDIDFNNYFEGMVYNSVDDAVYSIAVNQRRKNAGSLIKATYSGGTITLTDLGTPEIDDHDCIKRLVVDETTGNIFGASLPNRNMTWEYGSEFYQRIDFARFGEDDTIKSVISSLAEFSNFYFDISADRTISFIDRGSYRNDYVLDWSQNLIESNFSSGFWQHQYDAFVVKFDNELLERRGEIRQGDFVWQNNVLNTNNVLIQSLSSAQIVIDQMESYFSTYKLNPKKIRMTFTPEIRPLDRVQLIIPNFIGQIDSAKYFIVLRVFVNVENRFIELEALEI